MSIVSLLLGKPERQPITTSAYPKPIAPTEDYDVKPGECSKRTARDYTQVIGKLYKGQINDENIMSETLDDPFDENND